MLIVDDLLLAPFKGLLWAVQKIHAAALDEIESRSERITAQLSELYMQLETGKITEEEFDAREAELLDQLDQLDALQKGEPDEEEEEDDEGTG